MAHSSANMTSPSPRSPAARAAVLIVLSKVDGDWQVFYIRRSQREDDRHSGQVAFPGGRVEDADTDLIDTALREAEEEIGLPRDHVRVIGQLPDSDTSTGFVVTPVVALLEREFEPQLQSAEVARLFSIPLSWLQDADNHWSRLWRERPVVFFSDYDGENLWGASARMTVALIDALAAGQLVLPNGDPEPS